MRCSDAVAPSIGRTAGRRSAYAAARFRIARRPRLGPAGTLRGWIARVRQRRALAELDARLLDDIGVTPDDARREAAKPPWRP